MKMSQFVITIIYSFAMSVLVIFIYENYRLEKKMTKIYTVNSKVIIEKQREKLKEIVFNQKEKLIEDEIITRVSKMEKIIEYISKRDGAIILVNGAVLAGEVKDITDEVLKIYQENDR